MRKREREVRAPVRGSKKGCEDAMTEKPITTAAEINQKNLEFWGKRNAEIQEELKKAKDRPEDIGQAFVPTNDAERHSGLVDPLEKLKTTRLVRQGEKFAPKGRGKSPIRKRIEALLKKSPHIENEELWKEITHKLPKGWAVYNEPKMSTTPYLEYPDGTSMKYTTFCQTASAVRKELKGI